MTIEGIQRRRQLANQTDLGQVREGPCGYCNIHHQLEAHPGTREAEQ